MDHGEFVRAAQAGTLRGVLPAQAAAEYLSRRLLLPFFMMPILGAGVALALIGWLVTGLLVFGVGFVVPRWVKRNAQRILLNQAVQDERIYHDLLEAQVLQVQR